MDKHEYSELIGKRVRTTTVLYGLMGDTTPVGTEGVIETRQHYSQLVVRMDSYAWADFEPEWFEEVEQV